MINFFHRANHTICINDSFSAYVGSRLKLNLKVKNIFVKHLHPVVRIVYLE